MNIRYTHSGNRENTVNTSIRTHDLGVQADIFIGYLKRNQPEDFLNTCMFFNFVSEILHITCY